MNKSIPGYMLLMGELVALYEAALHYKKVPPETEAHWKERVAFLRSIDLFNLDADAIGNEIQSAKKRALEEKKNQLFQNPML